MSIKKNISFLIGGTALAQIFTLAVSPILARLYNPEHFGMLGLVLSISSIVAVCAHLRLNLAIASSNNLEDASEVFKAAILSCLIFSLCFCSFFFICNKIYGSAQYGWDVLVLVLVLSILNSIIDVFNYWQSYRGRYKASARNSIFRSFFTGFFQVILAKFNSLGLIFGVIVGAKISILFSIKDVLINKEKILYPIINKKNYFNVLKSNSSFPLYSMPQALFLSIGLNSLPLILGFYYGLAIAGQYWLAYRIVVAPVSLLAGAYRQALHPIFSGNQLAYEEKILLAKKHMLLGVLFISPMLIISFIFLDDVFILLFSEKWVEAAEIVKWLLLCFIFDIVKTPFVCLIHAYKKHKNYLIYEIVFGLLKVIIFILACYSFSYIEAIMIFSIFSLFSVWFLIYKVLFVWVKNSEV